ncbi:MAG: hypothetical protein H0X31_20390 [Nostocaceae cyanobacterium]|nr:hypothetical protein [Nostocaceae cyanobacterium]
MNLQRIRIHQVIELLDPDDLENLWVIVESYYYDMYMSRAIQEAKKSQQPWDTLTHEEALRLLIFL